MNKTYLTSAQVCARYGGISFMSLWRWQNTPGRNFPKPFKFGKRNFWLEEELESWEASDLSRGPLK